ncbi:MAG: VanW family protein [Candidatus Berkelbacteria bacterium Athens1014_28]|uniref:VanW family protein n=1 Tax=Candidatus Berkelbacteria bacterium Athens1014_28 TaxID=2017145 RepID=A0A554LJJ2_9BACT|nr:MAG: VanW family protein [Candidatus Berkelbacteria bacterium Athens1014_28]
MVDISNFNLYDLSVVKRKTKQSPPKVRGKKREKVKKALVKVFLWKKIKLPAIIISTIAAVFLIVFAVYSITFAKTSYRNIYIGDVYLGGKSNEEISVALKPKIEEFLQGKIKLTYQPESGENKNYTYKPADFGLSYDLEATTDSVYAVGRSGNILRSFYQQFKTLFLPYRVSANFIINDEALTKKVADIATEVDQPEKDFSLIYNGDGTFSLSSEKQEGKRINQDNIISNFKLLISNIKNQELTFRSEKFMPKISEENAKIGLTKANKILSVGELQMSFQNQKFSLDVDTIAGLIGSRPKKTEMEIYILPDRVGKQVEGIASQIDRVAGDAVLTVKDGKVIVSSESKIGYQVDRAQTAIDIENAFLSRMSESEISSENVALKVAQLAPEIDSSKLLEYGLTELVATATTSFIKSPANRVHNISIGAGAISGALIKPGEEFSTLKRLGKIDASTGYLPELVIKNNKTVPDYGGGLCQVSTTLFRTAIASGMKITARQNHSYRVSYYEPPIGQDATIYDPSPDFKFINNYSSYIFIQSKIVGTKITFEFYGTKDSRIVTITTPVGYDYVEPPPMEETPDPTLQPGERKQVQKPHQGASARFHYEVQRDGVMLQSTDFISHYVALPEKWQVGPPVPPAPVPDPNVPAA